MSDPWRAWFSVWETQIAAATTIAARTPIILSAARTGSPKAMRETQRMYTEKYAAAFDGAMAAGQEWAKLWMRMGGMVNWMDAATNASRIMQAAIKPAQTTCKANARRLGGGRKKKWRRR